VEELEARRAFGKVVVVPDAVFEKVPAMFIQGEK